VFASAQAVCKVQTRSPARPNGTQTRLPRVADDAGAHCLVVPGVVAVQMSGRRRTKPWMLEFASDVALDGKVRQESSVFACICWRLRQLEPTVGAERCVAHLTRRATTISLSIIMR
jgi:hypothetical protein